MMIGLGVPEIGLDEFVARLRRRIENGHVPAHGSVRHPVVVLPGDVAEQIATDRILVTVRAEKPDDGPALRGIDSAKTGIRDGGPVTAADIQKWSGGDGTPKLDRLGGQTFAKTKQRVEKQVRQMADELLAATRPWLPQFA